MFRCANLALTKPCPKKCVPKLKQPWAMGWYSSRIDIFSRVRLISCYSISTFFRQCFDKNPDEPSRLMNHHETPKITKLWQYSCCHKPKNVSNRSANVHFCSVWQGGETQSPNKSVKLPIFVPKQVPALPTLGGAFMFFNAILHPRLCCMTTNKAEEKRRNANNIFCCSDGCSKLSARRSI